MKILICDDKPDQAERTKRGIASRGSVEILSDEKLKQALSSFLGSVSNILDGAAVTDSEFDGYDVLIVDNNLTELQLAGARLTAEAIIGYLRAFADTPYIISLNKNPHVDFDLSYLFGDYQSLADLALNSGHLSNRRLWGGKSEYDFAPWYWPRIADAADRRRKQIKFITENFNRPVWEALGFPKDANDYLSLQARSPLLSIEGKDWETSFGSFFSRSRALPPAEITKLAKTQDQSVEKAVHRIAAYEVDRWLRRDVLGPQDVLIDLPHVLAQMPFLLGAKANNLENWNEVLQYEKPAFGLDEQLFQKHLVPAIFSHSMWVPEPCFWWPSLKSDDALVDRFLTARGDGWPDAVFCEDISHFVSITEAEAPPQEFEAGIDGSWRRRYVIDLNHFKYSPRARIIESA